MDVPFEIEFLFWDDWNRAHIAKHGISQLEVEGVVHGEHVQTKSYKGRGVVIGATAAGRIVAVVVGPVPGVRGAFYPFGARPASRKERRYYHEQRGD